MKRKLRLLRGEELEPLKSLSSVARELPSSFLKLNDTVILAEGEPIGVLTDFNPISTREVTPIYEMGSIGPIEFSRRTTTTIDVNLVSLQINIEALDLAVRESVASCIDLSNAVLIDRETRPMPDEIGLRSTLLRYVRDDGGLLEAIPSSRVSGFSMGGSVAEPFSCPGCDSPLTDTACTHLLQEDS